MSASIEDSILKAKQAAAEDMYEALQATVALLEPVFKINSATIDMMPRLYARYTQAKAALTKATYAVRPICPNCDTELPEGCGGIFKEADDGHCLWVETKKEPL